MKKGKYVDGISRELKKASRNVGMFKERERILKIIDKYIKNFWDSTDGFEELKKEISK